MKLHEFVPGRRAGVCAVCGAGKYHHSHDLEAYKPGEEVPRADHPHITAEIDYQLKAASKAAKPTSSDAVVMPSHYKRFAIEPLHFAVVNQLNPFQTKIVKYALRAEFKNGIEDLKKAKRVLEMYIKYLEGDAEWYAAPKETNPNG